MDLERLQKSSVGQLTKISGYDARFNEDYRTSAFLPDPLPEQLTLPGATH
jgi:hypothetical protein